MADIFISYKREDKVVAQRLSIALEQLGFDVWLDFELLSGDRFRKVIETVIDQCKVALVLWSNLSRESKFVLDEATYADEQNKLCAARIDDCRLPMGFGQIHTDDLRGWDGEMEHPGFQGLLRALEAKVGKKARLGARARSAEDEARLAELESFKAAQIAESPSALRAYLQAYPKGAFTSFVREQLKTAQTKVTAAASTMRAGRSADPFETPSPPPLSAYAPEPEAPKVHIEKTINAPAGRGKSLPWAVIAAGVAGLVAVIALAVQFMPTKTPAPAPQPAIEQPARDVDAEIEAARKAERDQAAADRAAAEQSLRDELAAKDQQVAGLTAKEQAARNQTAREQAAKDQAANEQATRDAARAAATPFGIGILNPDVRYAVVQARDWETRANEAGSNARDAASKAEDAAQRAKSKESGYKTFRYGAIAEYSGGFSNNLRNGFGIDTFGAAKRYAGAWRGDFKNGVGVWYLNQNLGNPIRYEGEFALNAASGAGIYYWENSNKFAGSVRNWKRDGPGVDRRADGSRHEGERKDDKRNGYGVEWDAQGRVSKAGIWTDDSLTTPLSK